MYYKSAIRRTLLSIATLCFLCHQHGFVGVEGNCSKVQESYSRDEAGGNRDNVQELGDDITKIDKIIEVVMRTGDFGPACPLFGCFRVIREMEVRYRMMDGTERVLRFGRNLEIKSVHVLDVPEDEVITKVEIRTGDYLDWVNICLSNGQCTRAGGGGGRTKLFEKSRSAIKAFFYKSGEVVDRLGVHYETDKIIRLESQDPEFSASEDIILTDVFSPDNLLINDNTEGSTPQTIAFSTSTQVTSSETTSISSTVGGSASLELKASAGIDIGIFSAGVESTVSIGASWSTTTEQALTYTSSVKKELVVQLEAPPGGIEQAETFYTQAEYVYTWTAPLTCYYSFDPKTAVAGENINGTTIGFAGIPTIRLKFTTVLEPVVPTMAPSIGNTAMPSLMPVVVSPTTTSSTNSDLASSSDMITITMMWPISVILATFCLVSCSKTLWY